MARLLYPTVQLLCKRGRWTRWLMHSCSLCVCKTRQMKAQVLSVTLVPARHPLSRLLCDTDTAPVQGAGFLGHSCSARARAGVGEKTWVSWRLGSSHSPESPSALWLIRETWHLRPLFMTPQGPTHFCIALRLSPWFHFCLTSDLLIPSR